MDLGAIRTAIETWVGSTTGLPVSWSERPQTFGATRMVLHLRGFRGVGLDEVSEEYDATTPLGPAWGDIVGGYTPTQTGQRVGTLEIRANTQSQADDKDALYYVQLLRDRLALPDLSDALELVGAAVGEILMEPRELSRTEDMRRVSSAQMDVSINATAAADGAPYGTIESVGLTLEVRDDDGVIVFDEDFTLEAP
jgi:hypothetical protein